MSNISIVKLIVSIPLLSLIFSSNIYAKDSYDIDEACSGKSKGTVVILEYGSVEIEFTCGVDGENGYLNDHDVQIGGEGDDSQPPPPPPPPPGQSGGSTKPPGTSGENNDESGGGGASASDDEISECDKCKDTLDKATAENEAWLQDCKNSAGWTVARTCGGHYDDAPFSCFGDTIKDEGLIFAEFKCDQYFLFPPHNLEKKVCVGKKIRTCVKECLNGRKSGGSPFTFRINSPLGGINYKELSATPLEGAINACRNETRARDTKIKSDHDACKNKHCKGDTSRSKTLKNDIGTIPEIKHQLDEEFDFEGESIRIAKSWLDNYVSETRMNNETEALLRKKLVSTTIVFIEQMALDEQQHLESVNENSSNENEGASSSGSNLKDTKKVDIKASKSTSKIRALEGASTKIAGTLNSKRSLGTIEREFFKFCHENLNQREYNVLVEYWPGGYFMFASRAFLNQ